jgi:outer membrane protein
MFRQLSITLLGFAASVQLLAAQTIGPQAPPSTAEASPAATAQTAPGQTPAAAAPNKTLSLAECVQVAEQHHPDVAAARSLVEAATFRVRESRGGLLPRIDFGQSYTRSTYNFAASPGNTPEQVELFYHGESSSNSPYYYGGLALNQTVYDFGRTRNNIHQSQAQLEASQQNLERTRQVVDLNVRLAYYGVLADEELVRVRKAALGQQRKHLDQIQAMYEVGTRPKIDLTEQRVEVSNAEVDLKQAEEDLAVARASLATAMGIPIDQAPEPANTLQQEVEPGNLSQLLDEARRNRPDVRSLRDQIDAAHAAVLIARTNFRPTISFGSLFNYRNLKFPLVYNWSLGQVLAQNIFNGGADRALISEYEANEEALRSDLSSLTDRVEQAVYTDFSDFTVAKERIDLAIQTEAEAKESLELAEGRYSTGYGNIIELTDAQYADTNNQAQEVSARYSYQEAAARLDADLGRSIH